MKLLLNSSVKSTSALPLDELLTMEGRLLYAASQLNTALTQLVQHAPPQDTPEAMVPPHDSRAPLARLIDVSNNLRWIESQLADLLSSLEV
jgi:hypothetical protein